MSAEENLNKIFRCLEKTRVSRILMDLYGEIKRNGNQRSLRICLNLFSYYAPQIREKHIKWYALRLLQCIIITSQRKETLLQETLCEFVKSFSRYVQQGLNDSETCKLLETFLGNISDDCAVKRRCSAQNCISLIEHARNRSLMARHALHKVIELLLLDQQTSCVLGALGFLRLLLPRFIRGYSTDCQDDAESLAGNLQQQQQHEQQQAATTADCRQIIEIYDYCLHLLSTQQTTNHAIINAALEVINSILQALDATATELSLAEGLRQLLCNQHLQHNEYLRRRKSLKNQIFQLKNYEVATSQQLQHQQQLPAISSRGQQMQMSKPPQQQQQQQHSKDKQREQQQEQQQQQGVGINADTKKTEISATDEGKKATRRHIRNAARSISECVASSASDDEAEQKQKQEAQEDMDMELLSGSADDEYDGFTTLSQLNEAQQTQLQLPNPTSTATTTTTIDKLIDAAKHDGNVSLVSKPQAVQHQSSLQNLLASSSDDRSQHLSDIDNESFNSIDFDAEITIAGIREQQTAAAAAEAGATTEAQESMGDATTIGTFFNNLLSHSNAASESVSKLFRQSSGTKSTPAKSAATATDKSDAVSTASLTLSLSSLASSNVTGAAELELQSSIAETPTTNAEDAASVSASASASYTASTALLMDTPAAAAELQLRRTPNANPFLAESSPLKQTIAGHALIPIAIGSLLAQPMLCYTGRLLAARFLLSGQAATLQPDTLCRVSIKSLSLSVIAQCVRLMPPVLQLQLQISAEELQLLSEASCGESTQASSPQGSNDSQLTETLPAALLSASTEAADELLLDIKDDHFGPSTYPAYLQDASMLSRSADATMLQHQLQSESKSAKLTQSEIIGSPYRVTVAAEDTPPLAVPPRPPKRTKSLRYRSAAAATAAAPITATATDAAAAAGHQALSDVLLYHAHSDPILRGGVQQIVGNFLQASGAGRCLQLERQLDLPHLLAILLKGFEDDIHTVVIQALNAFDKIFPHVVSKYLAAPPCHYHAHQRRQQLQEQQQKQKEQQQPSGQQKQPGQAQTFGQETFVKKLDNALSSQQQQQQQQQDYQEQQEKHSNDDSLRPDEYRSSSASATDNDELLAALLNDFQLQAQRMQQKLGNNNSQQPNDEPAGCCCVFAISPKLLLDKLRLCHYNRYWLVQNKYAEVVSNLNYILLRSYYANIDAAFDNSSNEDDEENSQDNGNQSEDCHARACAYDMDIVCTYEAQFLDELVHFVGDDDARVREHAALCLCRFIMQTARCPTQTPGQQTAEEGGSSNNSYMSLEAQQTNFNLLWDFFDYRTFGSMSVTLRNLFRASSTIAMPLGEPGDACAWAEMDIQVNAVAAAAGAADAATASAYFDGSYGVGIADGHVFAIGGYQRQIALEEKVLAKVLYRLTNKLMTLNDKNLQLGIIYTLRVLLKHFNFVDYQHAWAEFNFIEICMSHAYFNSTTAADLNCQNDLIDVMAKLMAGSMLSSGLPVPSNQLDFLLHHSVKLLNIYYHLVSNQRPVTANSSGSGTSSGSGSAKAMGTKATGKSELFTLHSASGKELAMTLQAAGYFASDYVYMKLYNILRGANDSYKITINHEAGGLLICLLKSCLNALSVCLEASLASASTSTASLKLIEEILQYLARLINYAPGECVACLRQLLKYLFGQNYASLVQRQPNGYHNAFVRPYFAAKCGRTTTTTATNTTTTTTTAATATSTELGALFVQGMAPDTPPASDCVRLIKLFEPLVIYCLTLFMKSNALVQAPILKLLSQLLDVNVTYSILDSKSVIFEQILSNLELIENGIDRNAHMLVPVMLKFLVQLTHKSDRQLITIPKIISITNNLLANGAVRNVALLALKTLSYELFFMHHIAEESLEQPDNAAGRRASCQSPLTAQPTAETKEALLAQRRELDTQKEVVLGMLEKFIEARDVQQLLALLLLYERSLQQLDAPSYLSAQDANVIYGLLCRALRGGQLRVQTLGELRVLESCFRNNGNYVLADSKEFLQLLQRFIEQDVGNFGDLAVAMITLAHVILKTEEIYLVNHIKLYLKNNPLAERRLQAEDAAMTAPLATAWQDEAPTTSSAAAAARAAAHPRPRPAISEINYFAKVLSEKLLDCLAALLDVGAVSHAYCQLAARFVNALNSVCCRSRHKDALQSVFRLVLSESEFLCKYYNMLWICADAAVATSEALELVLLECVQLLLDMRMVEPTLLLMQAAELPLKWSMQREILRQVCLATAANDWTVQQVRRLFAGKYLNFLIADHLEFLCELCQVRPECSSLLQSALLRHAHKLNRHSVRALLSLLWRLCECRREQLSSGCNDVAAATLLALQLLCRLHQLHAGQRELELPMERLARRLTSHSSSAVRSSIYERLLRGELAGDEDHDEFRTMLLQQLELEWPPHNGGGADVAATSSALSSSSPRIIDENWLFAQVIKFATQHSEAAQQQQQLMQLLLEIQSEPKLLRLLRSLGPAQGARLLQHALKAAFAAMLCHFRQQCVQHAPHINYMQLPALARVACALLYTRLQAACETPRLDAEQLDVASAVCNLLQGIRLIERSALIYIDAKQLDKFVAEQLLRPEQLSTLLCYMRCLLQAADQLLQQQQQQQLALEVLLRCLAALLQEPRLWSALNSNSEACNTCELRVALLHLLNRCARRLLQHTSFYQRFRPGSSTRVAPQAIFLAKLIATQIDGDCDELAQLQAPLSLIADIGSALLRLHQFYAYAVTPFELMQQQQADDNDESKSSAGKLPTIPVDSLSDVDVLRQFVKRLSIFGYTTRQQFEEYFMTFLLLINKQYDEHMVDQQEQFQIRQVCLQAIMELLTTHKTFPIVGQRSSQFYHTTRWQRINCDSISLKKLHKVQLLVDASNVFYLPNLERQLATDNVIGTYDFGANQCDLNFCWAQMEAYAQPATAPGSAEGLGSEESDSGSGELGQRQTSSVTDTLWRNYRHFARMSGIDFRSSAQLVFDVLQQMIEVSSQCIRLDNCHVRRHNNLISWQLALNHMLVLPNLVKFCEICESRDQIKWIKERALRLHDQIAMDDTISHQHIIYLLCRSQALLIPSYAELQHLATLIGNVYLKSSHCFIRIAALQGLVCLLECCSRTNTAMGKLSDELALLRDLIVGYINRHGIIDESPLQFSLEHTKLVWTLNYSLIEWTSKFVPQCHLLNNTIIAASKLLKTTHNDQLYLCVLHGLERLVVNSGSGSGGTATAPIATATATATATTSESSGSSSGAGDTGGDAVVTALLRHKIEKLALELLKMENEKFSIPALKLLLSCMYVGSATQLENTELSNGIVQDDPEIIALQNDKVDILLHCIKSSSRDAAWIYGQVLCQIIRDLVPPNEILTKVIKEFLAINQPHGDVIATIVYQVFRSAIDSSYLQMLQDWLICTLPTFLAQPVHQGVWGLSVIFLSASINLHLIKLFPLVLGIGVATPTATATATATATTTTRKLGQHEIALFVTAAQDFHAKLSAEQKLRFREAFGNYEQHQVYAWMLQRL
ncbi:htt [Drosophila busckii]|uniref:Htt n=1 Tax=Drosophila busckii TaxID=30019 RepID=A0A0M4EVA6_DROBS|nr:htt [Drosophila busckii]